MHQLYLWNCREISKTTIWRKHDIRCSHHLTRVLTRKATSILNNKLPWLPTDFHQFLMVGAKYRTPPKSTLHFTQTIIQNASPKFLSYLQKHSEDSVMMLISTQETLLINKVNKCPHSVVCTTWFSPTGIQETVMPLLNVIQIPQPNYLEGQPKQFDVKWWTSRCCARPWRCQNCFTLVAACHSKYANAKPEFSFTLCRSSQSVANFGKCRLHSICCQSLHSQ